MSNSNMTDSLGVSIALGMIKTVVCAYDLMTLPIYTVAQQPWQRSQSKNKTRAKPVKDDNCYSEWKRVESPPDHDMLHAETIDSLFVKTCEKYGDRKCLGYRETFGEEDEKQPDGRTFRKLIQGDFKWFTYNEVNQRINDVARGLFLSGLKPGEPVMIFAETRLEWFVSAMAAFRLGASIATLYATLGFEALVHGINETEVSHLITTHDLLPKIKSIVNKLPHLKKIIYIEGVKKPDLSGFGSIELISMTQVEMNGSSTKQNIQFEPRKSDDQAVIMYTSGSTGIPKGVIITHKNILGTMKGFYAVAHGMTTENIYMAYLPLAHVLELAAESFFISVGIPIGYSSPHTMTDKSTAVKKGCKGDAPVLQPTVMAAVPLVLDRIKKAVTENIDAQGPFMKGLFRFALEYKQYWVKNGFQTPLLNKIIFNKIKAMLGGKIQYMVVGSAPLAPDTFDFIRNTLNVILIAGYGLTETAAGGTIMDFDDFSVGRAGPPLYGLSIKLSDWEEGNYHPRDKPNPRGEVIIGGDCVTAGYFKNPTMTEEFYKVEDGKRWFYTGDIGEIYPDGTIKLIDRKKDLVKLQYGEYISLGKVETELKICSIVDNICVYGDSYHDYLIAIVVPNEKGLRNLAKTLNKEHLSHSQLCKDPVMLEVVKKVLTDRAAQVKLNRTERPAKILLVDDEWTPDSGLVTAAMKIRRKNIQERYINEINRMYKTPVSGVQSA
ncbi:long-chain-fatty-acid--CoA ligase 4-like [Panonychus citri]|uniref:long-chain-fatty-acid--CoA ligase 4-like n=1 Tax=Panonychus citri TaxID=50023 RepID=UPI0023071617|nr:long-chain-fatty-acid--CoA ligase 4-like [Panonychus citri]XP_053203630.1 long-chain-fatty-acid--CoA ligase 4-like [Panonychus citri]